MSKIKGFALLICLATPLSPLLTAASAETATPATPAAPNAAPSAGVAAPATEKPGMSEANKRMRAKECSQQADAKKLHGEERKKFREACKRS